ncbi:hypothetical protein SCUP234_05677 [Seiridium cupressi]
MAGFILKITATLVVLLSAALYQIQFPRMVSLGFGLGRALEPLSAFPYTCRRINHERLKACEDMWLSESTRQLFLACSEPIHGKMRRANIDFAGCSVGHLNVSGMHLDDAIVVLDLDDLNAGAEVKPRVLTTPGFSGTNGEGLLHLASLTGVDGEDGSIRLWVINLKPSLNTTTGELLDQPKVGANVTVELFTTSSKAETLEYVKTFAHPQIISPNRIAPVGGDSEAFYFTNDHAAKVGLQHHLSPLIGTGDVSFCEGSNCRQVARGFKMPNGLAKGLDGLIYVPSSMLGTIDVFQPQPNGDLVKVDSIDTGYSLDNLSVDQDGNIFAAAIPDGIKFLAANLDPYKKNAPATALKVTKKSEGGFEVTKVLEDGLTEVLPGTTSVVHDAKTGRVFFSGVFSPYIAVCDPK